MNLVLDVNLTIFGSKLVHQQSAAEGGQQDLVD